VVKGQKAKEAARLAALQRRESSTASRGRLFPTVSRHTLPLNVRDVGMALSSLSRDPSSHFGYLPSSTVPDAVPNNLVVPRVTAGGGGGALARNADGTRCAVVGRECTCRE
jgi:hypothetical protein